MATARAARAAAASGDVAATVAAGAEASLASPARARVFAGPPRARAIIGPHAGFSYCGHVQAHAYAGLAVQGARRVFLLGPSHHIYSREATVSGADAADTPLGALTIDADTRAALLATGAFGGLTEPGADEAEHSMELHMPFLAAALGGRGRHAPPPASIPVIPIMVGALPPATEAGVAAALAPYLSDPANLFIISSDFCHWGTRFGYTWSQPGVGLADGIEALDRRGMALIEAGDAAGWRAYLAETGNTVCGRWPISLFLAALAVAAGGEGGVKHAIAFTAYDQSSRCVGPRDSSVSYASAVVVVVGEEEDGEGEDAR
jgi:MEMO1 family protein